MTIDKFDILDLQYRGREICITGDIMLAMGGSGRLVQGCSNFLPPAAPRCNIFWPLPPKLTQNVLYAYLMLCAKNGGC